VSQPPAPVTLATFLRDVVAVSERQRLTLKEQTKDGFILWLNQFGGRRGVRTPFTTNPREASPVVLEVDRPTDPPQPPIADISEVEKALAEQKLAAWRDHRDLYQKIFAARGTAEGMELVVSFALLRGSIDNKEFDRHMLAAPAVVDLDERTGKLTVRVADGARSELNWLPSSVHAKVLAAQTQISALVNAESLRDMDQELGTLSNVVGPLLRHLPGEFGSPPPSAAPTLSPSPALLFRRREYSALLGLLNDMVHDLSTGGVVSEPFKMLLDPQYRPLANPATAPLEAARLALPADQAQRDLIKRVVGGTHTVIQGPPGTGKTHTIANLLSALLAEGKRVMVTAENERALHEVQGKLPESMRSLLLPLFRGGGADSLGSSVNDIIHRTNGLSTPALEAEIKSLEGDLTRLGSDIASKQTELRRIAGLEFEERTVCGVTMRLSGHLLHLAQQAAELALIHQYLSEEGELTQSAATQLLGLSGEVSDEHRRLAADLSVPPTPVTPAEARTVLTEIDSSLQALTAPRANDYTPLVSESAALDSLKGSLLTTPVVPWSEIPRTPEEYTDAANRARRAAEDVRHDVAFVGARVTDRTTLGAAIQLLEAMCNAPVDGRTSDQLTALHAQMQEAAGESIQTPHTTSDPWALWLATDKGVRRLQADRTGLLDRYLLDLTQNGSSDLDRIISALQKRNDIVPPDSPPISVEAHAPPTHELLQMAVEWREHLLKGGKVRGRFGTPAAAKKAAPLITKVHVDGSVVDTLAEVDWVIAWLQHRQIITTLELWLDSEGLRVPEDVSLFQWVIEVRRLPEVVAASRSDLELVAAARGLGQTLPVSAEELLSQGRAAAARIIADGLAPVAGLRNRPDVRIAGTPVCGKSEALDALRALKAVQERLLMAEFLPPAWQSSCNPLETAPEDRLVDLLETTTKASLVAGWARTAELSAASIKGIQEQVATDEARRQLRRTRDNAVNRIKVGLETHTSASPATQAARAAADAEDWTAYAEAIRQMDLERHAIALVEELYVVRGLVATAHPKLIEAFDASDPVATDVLQRIKPLERLRDHKRAVRDWQAAMTYPAALHLNLSRLHDEFRRTEQTLSDRTCWLRVIERLREDPRLASALSALSVAVQKVPKTKTAASYPSRLRAVQRATREAAPAIPAWVLSIDRAAELLGYPPPDERFDVIIIDEASQAWFPAMFLYALAEQVIVVGDDLQTSPAVNSGAEPMIRTLAKKHIPGHRLEDQVGDDLSLYDIASTMTSPDLLEDHFRCVPEIINISVCLSYSPNGKHLRPVRVRSDSGLDPVQLVRVQGSRSTGSSANTEEAEALVERVVACHSDTAYTGMTFGVVIVGSYPTAHIREIQSRILDLLGPEAIAARDLEIGTAAQFQGAERDVMFLSMLDVPNGSGRMTAKPQEFSGRNRRYVQQLNVAASRARDQIWVFHSFDAADLHPGDTTKAPDARLVLLQQRPLTQDSLQSQLAKCGSQFEQDVLYAIAAHNPLVRITAQVPSLGYMIDLVVEDGHGRRLAVECDGDKYHAGAEKVKADLYRERVLEKVGWSFYRFFASEWYADPDFHVRKIFEHLERQLVATSRQSALQVLGSATDAPTDLDELLEEDLSEDAGFGSTAPLTPLAAPQALEGTLPMREIDAQGTPYKTNSQAGAGIEADAKLAQAEVAQDAARSRSKKDTNKQLAAELRSLGKPPGGDTWTRAKKLVRDGRTIAEAARDA
jgi:very-short-patch-repair endonuclease